MKKRPDKASPDAQPAFVFDLDGTLIDSVYQHVLAFHEALDAVGVELPCWSIHRRIGMSDDLIVQAFARDAGVRLGRKQMERVKELHGEAYMGRIEEVPVLPGAKALLKTLKKFGVPYGIGTSSKRE